MWFQEAERKRRAKNDCFPVCGVDAQNVDMLLKTMTNISESIHPIGTTFTQIRTEKLIFW